MGEIIDFFHRRSGSEQQGKPKKPRGKIVLGNTPSNVVAQLRSERNTRLSDRVNHEARGGKVETPRKFSFAFVFRRGNGKSKDSKTQVVFGPSPKKIK